MVETAIFQNCFFGKTRSFSAKHILPSKYFEAPMIMEIATAKTFNIFDHNVFKNQPFWSFCMRIWAISNGKYLATLVFAVANCAVVGLSVFYSLVLTCSLMLLQLWLLFRSFECILHLHFKLKITLVTHITLVALSQ